MANYVVGDIQGCYTGLTQLLDEAGFVAGRDTLWAVGDLVARGPESLQTLLFLHNLGNSFHTVLGNHDLHFMAVSQGIKPAKRSDKLDALLSSTYLPTLLPWLRQFPLAVKPDKCHLISHAGLYPEWSFKQALSYSDEFQAQLRGPLWIKLLTDMYGNEPARWLETLEGTARSRFIVNAFTRMRFLDEQRNLEFACKSSPEQAPEHLQPWFKVSNTHLKPSQRILFGHWAALMGNTGKKRVIGLDTGYVWGNQLTLYHLEKRERLSIKA